MPPKPTIPKWAAQPSHPNVRLQCWSGPCRQFVVSLRGKSAFLMGSSPDADLVTREVRPIRSQGWSPTIDPFHCTLIHHANGSLYITDNESKRGTYIAVDSGGKWVKGDRLATGKATVVPDCSAIILGDHELFYVVKGLTKATGDEEEDEIVWPSDVFKNTQLNGRTNTDLELMELGRAPVPKGKHRKSVRFAEEYGGGVPGRPGTLAKSTSQSGTTMQSRENQLDRSKNESTGMGQWQTVSVTRRAITQTGAWSISSGRNKLVPSRNRAMIPKRAVRRNGQWKTPPPIPKGIEGANLDHLCPGPSGVDSLAQLIAAVARK